MNLHKLIAKYIKGKRVLDVGYAEHPNYFITDVDLYGVDIQEPKNCSGYLQTKKANLNYEKLDWPDNFFETVILADTIEHFENPSHVLRECNRVLNENGRIVISTPHANYVYDAIKNFLFSFFGINLDRDPGSHLSNWGILDFIRLLRRAGFSNKKCFGGFIHLFFNINIPVHRFPYLGWQVIYIADKVKKPGTWVYTKDEGNRCFYIDNP